MSAVYEWPLPEVTQLSGLLSSVEAQTRMKLPHVLQLQSSLLLVANAAFSLNLHEIFKCVHLKSTVSGRSEHS